METEKQVRSAFARPLMAAGQPDPFESQESICGSSMSHDIGDRPHESPFFQPSVTPALPLSAAFFCHLVNTVLSFFGILQFSTLSYVSDPNRQEKEIMQKVFMFLFFLSPVLALVVFCNRRSPTTLSKAATALAFVFLGAIIVYTVARVGPYNIWWGGYCYVLHVNDDRCYNFDRCGSTTC